jgi:hypothetical protein
MDQLGNKDDLTPSPKRSSSNRGCLTGETNDVVSSYGFALTEQGRRDPDILGREMETATEHSSLYEFPQIPV